MTSYLSALLVDPALFTAPYDGALGAGLEACGVQVLWAGRPLRRGEAAELADVDPIYYRGVQDSAKGRGALWKLRKAASHLLGGLRLMRLARRGGFDLVHFQWLVLPIYDAFLMRCLARSQPVVLTVHDLAPFNDAPTSRLQTLGFSASAARGVADHRAHPILARRADRPGPQPAPTDHHPARAADPGRRTAGSDPAPPPPGSGASSCSGDCSPTRASMSCSKRWDVCPPMSGGAFRSSSPASR